MIALLPSQVWYSHLGFVDHHAAVALATTGLLGAAMALFAVLPEDPRTPRRSVWLGVAMAAALADLRERGLDVSQPAARGELEPFNEIEQTWHVVFLRDGEPKG